MINNGDDFAGGEICKHSNHFRIQYANVESPSKPLQSACRTSVAIQGWWCTGAGYLYTYWCVCIGVKMWIILSVCEGMHRNIYECEFW